MSGPVGPPLSQDIVRRALKHSMRYRVNATGTKSAGTVGPCSTRYTMSGCTAISKWVMAATCQCPIRCDRVSVHDVVQTRPGLPSEILLERTAFLEQDFTEAVGHPEKMPESCGCGTPARHNSFTTAHEKGCWRNAYSANCAVKQRT